MKQIFNPEIYKLEDKINEPFIDKNEILEFLEQGKKSSLAEIKAIIDKSVNKKRLSLIDVAKLLNTNSKEETDLIFEGAERIKKQTYGNRIVIFAPLYVGNYCQNKCSYCGFNKDNTSIKRKTLTDKELVEEVEALEDTGHKRLILVYGEHKNYDAEFIAHTVRTVYGVKKGNGEIRRVNINAAPFDVEGYKTIKAAGIGTFQVFQETYDQELYPKYHLFGKKTDYNYRLLSHDRAMLAGIDDIGIGALFGLGDWKFEVLALVRHTNHLESCFGVGPHTISFPRIKEADGVDQNMFKPVSDEDFIKLVAILRIAIPYTGLILTAREDEAIRSEVIKYGVSQIDAGTNINIGGYSHPEETHKDQFKINDDRSLSEVIDKLLDNDYIPSFCTACYLKGRTGEHFMEFSVPGFIKNICTPNAILTLSEYLEDYGSENTKIKGYKIVERHLSLLEGPIASKCKERVERVRNGERNLLF
ncbi:MAG: [FeFe] hydrogenase H-cluster radical SAM maturase HydG [Bacteroidetes bacterium]|nr:[FeFe] hydrogenase H-cluster radical SAM maturase HydG [Bacteroidota bacterium]